MTIPRWYGLSKHGFDRLAWCISLAVLALMLSVPTCGFGYMEAIPEELQNKPEEERVRWLNSYFEEAYTLQMKVAKERHEQRQGMAGQFVQIMANQAFERQQLITEAEEETRRELERSARQANAAFGGGVLLAALGGVIAWWFYGRGAREV